MLSKLSHLDVLRLSDETNLKSKIKKNSTCQSDFSCQNNEDSEVIECRKKISFTWVREWQNILLSLVIDLPISLTVRECFVYIMYEFNKKLNFLGIKGTILNLNLNNYNMVPAKKSGLPKDDCPGNFFN